MAAVKVETGTKLDIVAQSSRGELSLSSTLTKRSDAGKTWLLARPMQNGQPVNLDPGTAVALSWGIGSKWFTAYGTVDGSVKQGVRTYLSVKTDGEVQSLERRSGVRIPAELSADIIQYETGLNRERRALNYPSVTSDISTGGVAILTNATLAVGEIVELNLKPTDKTLLQLKAEICWVLDAPKITGYHNRAGLQFMFVDNNEAASIAQLTAALAAKQ